jgi:hypothetical protein
VHREQLVVGGKIEEKRGDGCLGKGGRGGKGGTKVRTAWHCEQLVIGGAVVEGCWKAAWVKVEGVEGCIIEGKTTRCVPVLITLLPLTAARVKDARILPVVYICD